MIIFLRKLFYAIPILPQFYHLTWAWLGAVVYRFPSRRIFVLGVTGTKGKSTVLELIDFILARALRQAQDKLDLNYKVAVLSSAKVKIGDEVEENLTENTMPGRMFIQRFLRQAADAGCRYALIEVTSEGVAANRHRFVDWDAAMFLNLHPEHIERHGSFVCYREAKLQFFRYVARGIFNFQFSIFNLGKPSRSSGLKLFFVNRDDENAGFFIEAVQGTSDVPNIGDVVSPKDLRHPIDESDLAKSERPSDVQIVEFSKSSLPSKLIGEFNKYNVGAAVAFAESQSISKEIIEESVAEFSGLPGRMEYIQREPFSVVIDYAHTPDSLREVYKTFSTVIPNEPRTQSGGSRGISVHDIGDNNEISRHESNSATQARDDAVCGKLICVLGSAGGGRDKWKRPEMGKIAAEYCDEIILTNEDPYDENPEEILDEIEKGVYFVIPEFSERKYPGSNIDDIDSRLRGNDKVVWKILDRKEAIKKAISLAKPGDTVVITGKGSEKFIHIANGKKIPWSDRDVVSRLCIESNSILCTGRNE